MVLMMVVWLSKKEPEGAEISNQMKGTNLGDETVWMDRSKAECHGSTQDVDMVRKVSCDRGVAYFYREMAVSPLILNVTPTPLKCKNQYGLWPAASSPPSNGKVSCSPELKLIILARWSR
jgi:hypothetical protein